MVKVSLTTDPGRTAVKRRVRLLKDRAAVKLLREHYHGYEPQPAQAANG